jgi:hypothetical protein
MVPLVLFFLFFLFFFVTKIILTRLPHIIDCIKMFMNQNDFVQIVNPFEKNFRLIETITYQYRSRKMCNTRGLVKLWKKKCAKWYNYRSIGYDNDRSIVLDQLKSKGQNLQITPQ